MVLFFFRETFNSFINAVEISYNKKKRLLHVSVIEVTKC